MCLHEDVCSSAGAVATVVCVKQEVSEPGGALIEDSWQSVLYCYHGDRGQQCGLTLPIVGQ